VASVLLIEDDAPLVRLMAWFLLEAGFEVSKVADTDRAVERVRTTPPHVVVFNTTADDDAKSASITRMREFAPTCGFLDVCGHAWPKKPGDTGADRYLQLPFHADAFIEAVTELTHA
jgi:DNA-binding response OmpR family regulator